MGQEGLGRLFNIGFTFDDVYVNMRDVDAVTFVFHLTAGDTFTLTEAKSVAGASAQVLPTITQFYTALVTGAGQWTKRTQAAGSTVVTTGAYAAHVAVFTVRDEELSDGYTHLKVASTSTGTVKAILHDLSFQRSPELLPAISA